MTKNKFLSKRLACLLTTALVSTSIFTNLKEAKAADFTIGNGVTVTATDNDGAGAGTTAIAATDAVTLGGATSGINTGTAAITVASITTGATSTLTLSGTGGLITTGAITAAAGHTLTLAMAGTNLTVGTDTVATGTVVITTTGGTLTLSRAGAQAIAGTINGAGTVALSGAGTKTFAGIIGGTTPISDLTVATGSTGVFNAAVSSGNVTNSGTASFTTLNITGTGTLTGRTNASVDLVQSGTSEVTLNFATTVAGTTNTVVNHTGAAGTSLILGKAVTDGMIVFNTTDQTSAKILGKVYLPANLVNGQTLTLHNDVAIAATAGNAAAAIEATNLILQDTALTDYTAALATAANVVTSTDKSTSVTASELGVNTNKAAGLLQARNAAAAANTAGTDTSSIDAIFNVLNARGGQSATADTDFANQVSPQTDTITGSTIAAKAVTSGVQNVISTRLASLRSGDAYSTGIVTGSHMGANSGFIQAFGSQVEQKNKGNEFGYDADTTGFAIGFDTKVPGGAVIGISYAHSEADVDGKGTGRAKNDIKTDSVSLYADYATKDGYVEGSITYGKSDNKGSRVINTGGLSNTYASNYDSEQYSFRLSGGIPQSLGGGAFITPFAAATISQIKADAYTETSTTAADALRLRVSQDTVDSQVGTVGVKFHQAIKDGKTTFTPEVKLAVNQEFGDGNITTTNTYQGGGASFKNSTAVEKTSATAGLGLNISSDNLSFNIGYEADVKDKYLGHSAQAKITAKF
jgi:outer membrane autotransporter protein